MDANQIDYIRRRYLEENATRKELCEELGLTREQLVYRLDKHGIRKTQRTLNDAESKLRDADWLKEEFTTKSAVAIAKELGVKRGSVEYWLKQHGIQQRFKYTVDESKFDQRDPIFCYYAGLVATDGHLDKLVPRVTVTLKEPAPDVLGILADYFGYGGHIYQSGGRVTLCMSSVKLVDELEKMGIDRFSNKSFDVQVPTTFYSDDCMRMYLRGCIDGDGNLHKTSHYLRLYKGSEVFIDGLVCLINTRGINVNKRFMKGKQGHYPGFELCKSSSEKILRWAYEGYEPFALSRKRELVKLWKVI